MIGRAHPRNRVRRAAAAAAATILVALLPAVAAAGATPSTPRTGIVVVGAGGLRWTDIDRAVTPTLWRLIGQGSVASISVRTGGPQTCRVDGWLTLSATRRIVPPDVVAPAAVPADPAATPAPDDGDTQAADACRTLPDVAASGVGVRPADVTGWSTLVPVAGTDAESGVPGTLQARLAAAGVCSTAVGPGAAVALADAGGHVARYLPDTRDLDTAVLAACPVTLVDAGEPAAEADRRQAALHRLDDVVADVVANVPDGWRVVIAGLNDSPVEEPALQVVVDWQAGPHEVGWLTSDSTRRPGIVTLTDVAATVLEDGGAATEDLEGSALVVGGERRMSTERTVENRRYLTELTTTVPHLMPVFLVVLTLGAAGALAALGLARRRARRGVGAPLSASARRTSTAVLLVVASAPAGAYLAALSRWWGAPAPTLTASAWTAAAATGTALAAWFVSRLLPRGFWRLGATVAAFTWGILTVDGLTGTTLQHGSLLGVIATLGARYFGFGNLTFAVYLASALITAGAIVAGTIDRRPRLAAASVLVVGLVTVGVDGWPAFGADFGGVFAIVPAFALLLLAVLRAAPTPRRVLVTAGITAATVTAVALVDWMQPGGGSHVGRFVERLVEGQGWPVISGKATAAWHTIANPGGAVVTLACVALCVALVGPARVRPAFVDRAYRRVPFLAAVARSVVVGAAVGTAMNDSGIAVGGSVLAMSGVLLCVSWAGSWHSPAAPAAAAEPASAPLPASAAEPASAPLPASAPHRAPRAFDTPVGVLAVGGGLLAAMLLGSIAAPGLPVAAGDVAAPGAPVVVAGDSVVVIGTSGLRWQDVDRVVTPTLWQMLRDGAAAGGVTAGVTGADRRCTSAGWLALSAGRSPVTGERFAGPRVCAPWAVDISPAGDAAVVAGWERLADLQRTSRFHARLGVLAQALADAGVCTTAVGSGAALALADADGSVDRYLTLEAALATPDAFAACPVTIVDAGAAPLRPQLVLTPGTPTTTQTPEQAAVARQAVLTHVDRTVAQVLAAVPDGTKVVLVDVGDPTAGRVSLGVGLSSPGGDAAHFLSASSTRWEGVVRLLDVPTTLLAAVGAENPPELSGSPVTAAGARASDVGTAVDQLADLGTRDQVLRGVSGSIATLPTLLSLLLFGAAVWLGRRSLPSRVVRRVGGVLDAALLLLASMPAGLFLMSAGLWWRMQSPGLAMWVSLVASTVIVAGIAALAPRRPSWAAPAVIAGITAGILTLDALLGTPLHRGSPLGPAPALGGRYYGFGNPTYSVYVVAALITIAAAGAWLARSGRRRLAGVTAAALSAVALVVDLWPTLGADVGGGLVLVPVCAVVVLAVVGVRASLRRLAVIAFGGLVLVAGIGVLDWMRPAADRSHLGRFVQSAVDGTAWETVSRKAGYALATVTAGPTAWLTLVLVLALVVLVWPGSPLRARWLARVEAEWPIVRPVLVAMLLAAVGGAVANDYGVRIATLMLFAAVPLVGLLVVRTLPVSPDPGAATAPGDGPLPCEGSPDVEPAVGGSAG